MKTYICDTRGFDEERGINLVTKERREKINKYKFAKDRVLSLVAGLMLARFADIDDSSSLQYGKHGKPYAGGGLHFNISHSDYVVLLAVGHCEVGVDVERIRRYSPGVARRCFTSEEIEFMEKDENNFFKLWTAKESIMKGTGRGFSLSPNEFSVLPIDERPHSILGSHWHLYPYSIEGYEMCTATNEHIPWVEYIHVCEDDLF